MKIKLKSDLPYMSSMCVLPEGENEVLDSKIVEFASGPQTYYIVKSIYGQNIEVPARFVDVVK